MKIDEYGICIYQDVDIFNMLYSNIVDFSDIIVEESSDIEKLMEHTRLVLNKYEKPTISLEEFDKQNQNKWLIPEEYVKFDIYEYCIKTCSNDEQLARCCEELVLFEKLHMMELFGVLKYIVDTMRTNNVIWGVGRGSSVASYVLYLLGIHRIDSMKYNLDYREFLRVGD